MSNRFGWDLEDVVFDEYPPLPTVGDALDELAHLCDDFNPELHPHAPGGSPHGGEFVPTGGGGKKGLVALFEQAKSLRKQLKAEWDPAKRAEIKNQLLQTMKDQHTGYLIKGNIQAANGIAFKLSKFGFHVPMQTITAPEPKKSTYIPTAAHPTPLEMPLATQGGPGWLEPHEKNHLKNYTASGYKEINYALRNGVKSEQLQARINAINSGLAKLPPYVGEVRRFAQLQQKQWEEYKVGVEVEERGFTSTSKRPDWGWSGGTKFLIQSKTGRDVSHLSNHPGEQEVLFQSGTRFRVTHREGKVVHMEEV